LFAHIFISIKSQNCLLELGAGSRVLRCALTDFGLAVSFEDDLQTATMTVCGTPGWTAPEVLGTMMSAFTSGARTKFNPLHADMFACGLVTHHIVTGQSFDSSAPTQWRVDDRLADRLPPFVCPSFETEEDTRREFTKLAALRDGCLRCDPSARLTAVQVLDVLGMMSRMADAGDAGNHGLATSDSSGAGGALMSTAVLDLLVPRLPVASLVALRMVSTVLWRMIPCPVAGALCPVWDQRFTQDMTKFRLFTDVAVPSEALSGFARDSSLVFRLSCVRLTGTWQDQGWGNHKGHLVVRLVRRGRFVASWLSPEVAPHKLKPFAFELVEGDRVVDASCPGDTLALRATIGAGGGHELHLRDVAAEVIYRVRS
jgi:Protein kinase domain